MHFQEGVVVGDECWYSTGNHGGSGMVRMGGMRVGTVGVVVEVGFDADTGEMRAMAALGDWAPVGTVKGSAHGPFALYPTPL